MSEYQYYDFRAVDRPLTEIEMDELRSISTRAAISSTSFTNHYEWGNLKANPTQLLKKYFDAFVYVANWGTRELSFRLPQNMVDFSLLSTMLRGEAAQVQKSGTHLILEFMSEVEYDEWDDGASWMGSLMPLRAELMRGDLRCLYLGWLLCAQHDEFAEDDLEPPVPPGLGQLSACLQSLIEFLQIDEDLVEVAALNSAPLDAGPDLKELHTWVRSLSEKEKDDLLRTALSEQGERWKIALLRRFEKEQARSAPAKAADAPQRTVSELLEAARTRSEERSRQEEARRATEAARRKAEDEAKRAQYLDQLEQRKAAAWDRIAAHIQTKQPNGYDSAVTLLADLRDLALRKGNGTEFQSALAELRRLHAAKPSFLRRLTKAKL